VKKLLALIIACLVAWNGYLTYMLLNINNQYQLIPNRTIVNQSVSKITTDLSVIVGECEHKVVMISTFANNNLIASGSGVIYQVEDKEVFIVTNNHVVENGSSFKIKFANGEEIEAHKVGGDALTDIAVLSAKPEDADPGFMTEPFRMGDSSLISVGEYVIAIGAPLGGDFQGSTTFGIISGKDRVIPVDLDGDGIEDWDSIVLQTDAAINPGNSGGALVNLAGELIGITSMKISNPAVEGMGFAIPINEVVSIVEQLKEFETVKRPRLGITGIGVSDLSNMEKNYYKVDLTLTGGVLVTSVLADSAAEQVGIRPGDVIIKIDTAQIIDYKQFRQELYKKEISQKISLEIYRDGQIKVFEVILPSN